MAQALCEVREIVRGKAVEDEVGDDEVTSWELLWVSEVCVEGLETVCGEAAAPGEQVQHFPAAVYGDDVEVGTLAEERGGEAAVAVAEDERCASVWELREVVAAGLLE